MTRRWLCFVLALAPALAGAVFHNGRVTVCAGESIDIVWDRAAPLVVPGRAFESGIEVNGRLAAGFAPTAVAEARRVTDPEFGPALEIRATGRYRNAETGVALERVVTLLLPDRHPDTVLARLAYRNRGATTLQLGRVYSQRARLDRRLAEPGEASWDLATLQGGAYQWGLSWELMRLKPGFRQTNFQGLFERTDAEGEGGGMPFIDLWSPSMGVALAHIEKLPQFASLPVEVQPDGTVEAGVYEQPLARLKQTEWLKPGAEFTTILTAMMFHHGDSWDALAEYGRLLRARGIAIPERSPGRVFEPYWKSWGLEFDFTPEKVLGYLPELKSLGIRIANLDDGWFDWYGDWMPNRKPDKFPGGETELKAFVKKIHDEGFRTAIWWYPMGVSPESRLAKEHPEYLVMNEQGEFPTDDRKLYQFCPAYAPARQAIADVMKRLVVDYDFDGVYVDSTGLTAVPACFNPAHHHASPIDSFQAMPRVYQEIDTNLKLWKKDPWLEVCICAMPHSPYYMPYYPVANASDPTSAAQTRRRVKVERAIRGPSFGVGDCYQVPLDQWREVSVPESFESALGTGAGVTTFYKSLSAEQRERWKRWIALYRELKLYDGEYLNLYDVAFDKPEAHAIRKGEAIYYAFYAEYWGRNRPLELRGLDPARTYAVYDYANGRELGTVKGAEPKLAVGFKESLLVRVTPVP
jgi:alpha-galactosidase